MKLIDRILTKLGFYNGIEEEIRVEMELDRSINISRQRTEDRQYLRDVDRVADQMFHDWVHNPGSIIIANPVRTLYMIYDHETAQHLNSSFHKLVSARFKELQNTWWLTNPKLTGKELLNQTLYNVRLLQSPQTGGAATDA